MSKKILALVLSAALALSMCLTPALAASSKTYPDAVGNWAESSIKRWSDVGIVTGDDTGRVHPGQALRRCELATVLVRLLGLTQRAADNTFTDVPAGAWYADAILKCAAAGIMEGYGGRADPEDNITREQAITMIGRALGVQSKEGQSLAKYRDADSAFAYSKGYLSAFTAMGILKGVGDGSRVAPKQSIDRASAFALLDRAIGAYVTTPGVVEINDANQFVVINAAAAGDVTLTGKCAGVLITHGNRAGVKLSKLTADTVKVDAPVKVEVINSSKLGSMDLNAPAAVEVGSNCTVGSINTDDATKNGVAPTIKDQSTSTNKGSSGGSSSGGGGGYRPPVRPSESPEPSGSPEPSTSPEPSESPKPSQSPDPAQPVYSIALDVEKVELKPDQTATVTATVTPAGAEVYALSSDTQVADVAVSGNTVTITAVKEGTATVTVGVVNGPTKSVSVTVTTAGEPGPGPDEPETTYTITVDTVINGTVTADKTQAKAGESVTLSVTPGPGYELDVLTVEGVEVTVTDGVYAFEMPAKDVNVTATFKKTQTGGDEPTPPGEDTTYTVTCDTAVNGTVTADKAQAKAGDSVTITVTPATGYELDVLTVRTKGGVSVTVTNGKFTMPAEDVSVAATFKKTQGGDEPTPPTPEVDRTALAAALAAAKAINADSVKTSADGTDVATTEQWVTAAVKTALAKAITDAEALAATATQAQVDAAAKALEDAVTAWQPAAGTKPDTPDQPTDVTVTLSVTGDAVDAVESVTLGNATWANGVYTVEKDTDVTVVVTLKGDKDADAYTVSADTITFTVSGNTFQATVRATADMTVTITVAKKPDAEPAKQD